MKSKFVLTKNVKGFINLIHNLKNKSDNISKIGLVYGNAGLGKRRRQFICPFNLIRFILGRQIK